MPSLKLKVLNAAGDTLAVSAEGERASLVYTAAYAPGDWIALETDVPGLHCVVQLEDTMPYALVYIKGREGNFSGMPEKAHHVLSQVHIQKRKYIRWCAM